MDSLFLLSFSFASEFLMSTFGFFTDSAVGGGGGTRADLLFFDFPFLPFFFSGFFFFPCCDLASSLRLLSFFFS